MPAILRHKRYTTQPQGRVELRDEYKGAHLVWLGSNPDLNISSNRPVTERGVPTRTVTPIGKATRSTEYGQRHWFEVRQGNPAADNWRGITVISDLFTAPDMIGDEYPSVTSFMPVGEYYGGWNLSVEYANPNSVIYWRAGNSASALQVSDAWSTNIRLRIGAVFDRVDGTRSLSIVKNDDRIITVSGSHAVGWRNSASVENIGGYERRGYRSLRHNNHFLMVLPWALAQDEIDSLIQNPYSAFKADPERLYFVSNEPVANTIQAQVGDAEIAGQTVAVEFGGPTIIEVVEGRSELTGSAIDAQFGGQIVIDCQNGNYAYSGNAITIEFGGQNQIEPQTSASIYVGNQVLAEFGGQNQIESQTSTSVYTGNQIPVEFGGPNVIAVAIASAAVASTPVQVSFGGENAVQSATSELGYFGNSVNVETGGLSITVSTAAARTAGSDVVLEQGGQTVEFDSAVASIHGQAVVVEFGGNNSILARGATAGYIGSVVEVLSDNAIFFGDNSASLAGSNVNTYIGQANVVNTGFATISFSGNDVIIGAFTAGYKHNYESVLYVEPDHRHLRVLLDSRVNVVEADNRLLLYRR